MKKKGLKVNDAVTAVRIDQPDAPSAAEENTKS
jgi:hypothetical protein